MILMQTIIFQYGNSGQNQKKKIQSAKSLKENDCKFDLSMADLLWY